MRLETAVERLRTDFDVEPAAALDAPAPEVPEGTTLAGPRPRPRARAAAHGPDQPARARGARRARRSATTFLQQQLEDVKNEPARAAAGDPGRRPARSSRVFEHAFADVQRALRRAVRHAVPRRRRAALPHRPRRPAQHRHRDGGAPVGQERAPPVAAVRWRALAHRAGVPVRGVPRPAVALLPDRRGRGRARRREPAPVPRPRARVPQRGAAADRLAPEAHDGGGRLPLRRVDAARRLEPGRQPAGRGGHAERGAELA